MPDAADSRYPGYDVLAKWDTPSWNEPTRRVIGRRLAIRDEPQFFSRGEWATLQAICARIVPQRADRPAIPVAGLVDHKLRSGHGDGYRDARLPELREAWRRGLKALEAEAVRAHGRSFNRLGPEQQDALLRQAEAGKLSHPAWSGMPPHLFFKACLLRDIVQAYYAHPTAWSEIGFGGPASPRGYVRMGFDRRDPWEAAEAREEGTAAAQARRSNRRVR
ncbi:MAG: gluconate 2-dehydrogenase subunit 3 family protein [Rhodospirillales bacterium]|nr:gluconate 2-dehydrogenase subunit 3 family protein [Rhodospirillales bacterium]